MSARVLLIEAGSSRDVFEVVAVEDGVVRVRTAFLFEIGEELKLSIEQDGKTVETQARVQAHVADGVTELELVSA